MSFGGRSGLKQEPQKPLGITPRRASTHEQARPVPYFVGTGRIAATFISPPWGVRSEEVKSRVGKKKETVGYLYFCSFAALLCVGPVHRLRKIILDGEVAWSGDLERFAEDSSTITVEGFGVITFYWGTETQTIDAALGASGQDHPAYRGQCYAVFNDWLLGKDRNTVSNIVFELERFPTTWSWITTPEINGDANPILPFMEWWTNTRFGLGLSTSLLSLPDLEATAAKLATEELGISPILTSGTTMQALTEQLLDHIDGYLGTTSTGKLFIGLNRVAEDGDPAPTEITTADLTEQPELSATGWDETVNQVFIRFQNSAMDWETDAVSFRDPASFEVNGGLRAQTITREWVTKQKVAWAIAGSICRQRSRPVISGSIRVRFRVGVLLMPGTKFLLTYGRNEIAQLPCLVKEWSHPSPSSAEITLSFIEDRTNVTLADTDVDADDFPDPDSFDVTDLDACLIREMPFAYTETETARVAFMPARGSLATTSAAVHKESAPSSYEGLGAVGRFASSGVLGEAFSSAIGYASETARMQIELTSIDDEIPDASLTDALDGALLVFIGDEIFRAYDPQLVAPSTWAVSVLRGAYGSPVQDHADGATVTVIWDADRSIASFALSSLPAARVFKVQPSGWGGDFPLEDCPARAYTITRTAVSPLGPESCSVNGARSGAVYSTGSDIIVDWVTTGDLWETASEDAVVECRADKTLIEIRSSGGTLYETLEIAGNVGPVTITNADLIFMLGGEVSFQLRVYFSHDGVRSIGYTGQAVQKI